MAKKCLTKRVKKYGTGGFGADQLIQGLSGIMPVFADLSDDGKVSGATIGQSIGSGLGFASNFIPGIGPIASQAITPLLSAAGNFIGGLFDKPKKPRIKPNGYNISSGVNMGNYSFAMGGPVPAQTEVDETVYNPQTNNLDDTNAVLPHNQMGNQITDMLSPGEYVFPSHASAPSKKRTAKQWQEVFAQLGAEDILKKISLTRGKRYSAADLSELIDKKYTPKQVSDDIFAENTNQLMEQNKEQAMQVLMVLNEMDKAATNHSGLTDQIMSSGGFVQRYGEGAFVKPSEARMRASAQDYADIKKEYFFNNAFARYVSWRIANSPENSEPASTAEYLNDFNDIVRRSEAEIRQGEKVSGVKDNLGMEPVVQAYRAIADEYQAKLVERFPNKGYENYPETQTEPGALGVVLSIDRQNTAGPVTNSQYSINTTTIPYSHRTDVVNKKQKGLKGQKDSMRRGMDRTLAFNDQEINYAAGTQLLRRLFNNTLNTGTTAPESDQIVEMQKLGNAANPAEEAAKGRIEPPNISGYPKYRQYYTYTDTKTGKRVTVVLPVEKDKMSREAAIKEYERTGKHYGKYMETETHLSEQLAEEGSLWQKVEDKMKNKSTANPQEVVTEVKAQENKGKKPKTFKELEEQDAEIRRIREKIVSGKPLTQQEGDYVDNKAKDAGLEKDTEYIAFNNSMKLRTSIAIGANSKDENLYDYKNLSTPTPQVHAIIDKNKKGQPLTGNDYDNLYQSPATSADSMTATSAQDRINTANNIKDKQSKGIPLSPSEKEFIGLGYMEMAEDDIITGRYKNDEPPVEIQQIINKVANKEGPLTEEEIAKLQNSSVPPNIKRETLENNANIVVKTIAAKVDSGQPLTKEDIESYRANIGKMRSAYITEEQEDKIDKAIATSEPNTPKNVPQTNTNVNKLDSIPSNQPPAFNPKVSEPLPEAKLPGPIEDNSPTTTTTTTTTMAPPNNRPTYYDLLEQQQSIDAMNKKAELNRKPTFYDTLPQGETKFYLPGNWYGPPINPDDPWSLKTGIPVQPIDPFRGAASTSTVTPNQEISKIYPKGVIPQPDLSRFGQPKINEEPTFYDTPAYQRGKYNKKAEDKKEKFGWGDPSMWAQFAGDTMALFANMRQKAPKLKGYSDAPYRALYQQMVPNYGLYDNLTNSTLNQQQNALRGSISNPSLLAASQNQQVAQGLKAQNSAALNEQQRIDQIRQSQLSGIDQIARANVQIGNENMANKVALENAKKSAIAQYGQTVAKNMAERRYTDMQNQLYSGLYENTYPYAGQVDVSQFFPRFGRAKKNNGYGR